jgi:hypothetical protein
MWPFVCVHPRSACAPGLRVCFHRMSPVLIPLQNTSDKSFLINVLDTPGHTNFSDEVSLLGPVWPLACVRTCSLSHWAVLSFAAALAPYTFACNATSAAPRETGINGCFPYQSVAASFTVTFPLVYSTICVHVLCVSSTMCRVPICICVTMCRAAGHCLASHRRRCCYGS